MKRLTLFLAALFLAAPGLRASEPVDERRTLSERGVLQLEMISGSVEIIGWDKAEVAITGQLHDVSEQLEIDSDGDEISIEVSPPSGRFHNLPPEKLEIHVPRTVTIEIETVSAPINATGLEGDVSLSSISGSIRLKGDLRRVEAATVSGTITLEDGGNLQSGEFETVSGTIKARANFQPRGSFEFETVSGMIELFVPAGVAADFEVETFSGSIKNELGPEPRRTGSILPAQELNFSIGSGGARISIQSFSGRVRIRKE